MTTPSQDPDQGEPTLRFEATPYRAEGGFTLPGLLLVLVFSLVGGMAGGALAGWIAQWFYLIVLFPLGVGFVAGGCGAAVVRWGKLRNAALGIFMGIVSGCLAMATLHFVEFRHFLVEAEKANPGVLQLQFSPGAFGQFIDLRAKAGVEIMGRGGQKAMNLGYYGSYIYWILEIGLVGGFAATLLVIATAAPFCSACESWKTVRKLGRVNVPRAFALQAISSGEIARLAGHSLGSGPGRLSLDVAVCPNCGSAAPVDVSFKEVTVDDKGNEKQTEIAHVTYPGEALVVLEALFETTSQGGPVTTEARPAADHVRNSMAADQQRIVLRPVKPKYRGETWELDFDENVAILVDSAEAVQATIQREEAKSRVVFPSFWQSVRNLGILTDEGKVVWFKPDKTAVREIKKNMIA